MKPAYYNENDKKAAAWLCELIKAGVIADGDVDERSITDVCGEDLSGYGQCHFFAGIGGWSYALRLAGIPDDEPVWTGSCPCQPFSAAGKQKGEKDERHLWPEFWRLIRERSPHRIFGEQVANSIGFGWIDGVRADLETEAYALGIAVLGAHSVGAPHIRQRLYWVAEPQHAKWWPKHPEHASTYGRNGSGRSGNACWLGDSNIARSEGRSLDAGEYADQFAFGPTGSLGRLGESQSIGLRGRPNNSDGGRRERAFGSSSEIGGLAEPNGWNPGNRGLQRGGKYGFEPQDGGIGWVGHPNGSGCETQRDFSVRDRARSTQPANSGAWSDFGILHCTDGKARRIEAGTFPLATGIPARMGRLRGYGNAIVPQAAAEFIFAATEAITQGKQK